jgi:hypothetical protein
LHKFIDFAVCNWDKIGVVITLLKNIIGRHLHLTRTHFLIAFLTKHFFLFSETGVWTQGFVLVKQVLYHLTDSCSPFCSDNFWRTICPSWLWTMIFMISASQEARVIGISSGHYKIFFFPPLHTFFKKFCF